MSISRLLDRASTPLPEPDDYFHGYRREPLALPDNLLLFRRRHERDLKQRAFINRAHSRYVLILVLETAGEVIVDEHAFPLEAGEAMLVFPYQLHDYQHLQQPTLDWLFLTFELSRSGPLEALRNQACRLRRDSQRELTRLCEAYLGLHERPAAVNELALRTATLLEALRAGVQAAGEPRARSESPLIAAVNRYLFEHLRESPGIEQLAQNLGMSERALRTRFEEQSGQRLGHYLRDFRMRRAEQLLSQSNMPVYSIAEQCGFGSAAAFCRAFRRENGKSPKAYRRR